MDWQVVSKMAIGDVVARIVRSDGEVFQLGYDDWRIPNDGLENWANLPYNVSSVEIPNRDGAIVTAKRVSSVDRTITAQVGDPRNNAKQRAAAIRFFNPKYTYECHMTYQGRTRWTEGEQIGFKCSEGNIYEPATLTWTILCPNPYLRSESDFGRDIAEAIPMLGFPFMSFLPVSEGSAPGCNIGFVASIREFGQIVNIENDGDVDSDMKFVMKTSYAVINPIVRIGDAFIKILHTLTKGETLILDMTTLPPKITLNGKNAIHLVDRNSSIMALKIKPGETTIEYDADDGEQYMSVEVFYNKQYLGI